MAAQETPHHRTAHFAPQLLRQCRADGRQHKDAAFLGLLCPRLQKFLFLDHRQQGTSPPAPRFPRYRGRGLPGTERALQAGDGGPTDAQHARRLLQGGVQVCGQQDRQGSPQFMAVLRLLGNRQRFLHNLRINFSESCHAQIDN